MRRSVVSVLVALLVAAGCSNDDDTAKSMTTRRTTTTASTGIPSSTSWCPDVEPRNEPDPKRPQYTLSFTIGPQLNTVDGTTRVAFIPDLDTDRLVFRLWANSPRITNAGGGISTRDIRLNGSSTVAIEQPDPTTLVLRPGETLVAGKKVDVEVGWNLRVPAGSDDRVSLDAGALRLGSFYPVLPWEPGVGWATEPPTSGFAETSVSPIADYEVDITAPEGVEILGSGKREGRPNHWRARAVHDVAYSVGDFEIANATIRVPHEVEVSVGVAVPLPSIADEDPDAYLADVVDGLEENSERFGRYAWDSFTLAVTSDLGGGIEYPTHVMQGPSTVGAITSHEVAHMWFYALVVNNQGRHPFLDEGLTTYAEWRLESSESTDFPLSREARGRANEPMTYWEGKQDAYYAAVYAQPAVALLNLGTRRQVDCMLRHYVAENAYEIATPEDLQAAAHEVFDDPDPVFQQFGLIE